MNLPSIIEALFVALCATTVGFILCAALVGIWWFTVERQHEADALTAAELDIPHNRDFTEPKESDYLDTDYAPCAPIRNSVLSPQSSELSIFPHDPDYDSTPNEWDSPVHPLYPKRF